jgi:hypothetical protein
MSRAERRQYQKMMKSQDPYAPRTPPGGGRPPKKRTARAPRDWSFTRGFWLRSVGIAAVAGVVALSVAWSSGAETALLAGGAVAVGVLGILALVRLFLQRRTAPG